MLDKIEHEVLRALDERLTPGNSESQTTVVYRKK